MPDKPKPKTTPHSTSKLVYAVNETRGSAKGLPVKAVPLTDFKSYPFFQYAVRIETQQIEDVVGFEKGVKLVHEDGTYEMIETDSGDSVAKKELKQRQVYVVGAAAPIIRVPAVDAKKTMLVYAHVLGLRENTFFPVANDAFKKNYKPITEKEYEKLVKE